MRKFGLMAAILGSALLVAGLLLRMLASSNTWTWAWVSGAGLFALGVAVSLWSRINPRPSVPMPNIKSAVGTDTARLLDNFEQRFAELKGRKPNANVLRDLYTLGNQLEQRGRAHA